GGGRRGRGGGRGRQERAAQAPRRRPPPASPSCPAPCAVRFHGCLLLPDMGGEPSRRARRRPAPAPPAPLLFGAGGRLSWRMPGSRSSWAGVILPFMTATNDPAGPAPSSPEEPMEAQFGPHRFDAGEGGGDERFRGARFEAADLRGARFTDCDLTGVTIRDGWLVNVSISGYLSNVTVNGVDVTDFVNAELDRRHPERVQFREGQTADDVRALWGTIERLWAQATERAGPLPAAGLG